MSNNINFSGSLQRALKGDVDPINLFGINPSRAELRANVSDRQRRSSQIAAEQGSESIAAAGGFLGDPTKQVKKLSANQKTSFRSLSPLAPPGGLARTVGVATEIVTKDKKKKESAKRLARKNRLQSESALTVGNLKKKTAPQAGGRFSDRLLARSILGGVRG